MGPSTTENPSPQTPRKRSSRAKSPGTPSDASAGSDHKDASPTTKDPQSKSAARTRVVYKSTPLNDFLLGRPSSTRKRRCTTGSPTGAAAGAGEGERDKAAVTAALKAVNKGTGTATDRVLKKNTFVTAGKKTIAINGGQPKPVQDRIKQWQKNGGGVVIETADNEPKQAEAINDQV